MIFVVARCRARLRNVDMDLHFFSLRCLHWQSPQLECFELKPRTCCDIYLNVYCIVQKRREVWPPHVIGFIVRRPQKRTIPGWITKSTVNSTGHGTMPPTHFLMVCGHAAGRDLIASVLVLGSTAASIEVVSAFDSSDVNSSQ